LIVAIISYKLPKGCGHHDGKRARRWLALLAVAMSLLVVGLDLTVLNLALPSIANALHASTSHLQWFSDAYSLVLAAAVLPAGTLGDRYGRKRVLMTALAIFRRELGRLRVRGDLGRTDCRTGCARPRRRRDHAAGCGGSALASALLALAFLPRRARDGAVGRPEPVPAGSAETSSERAELGI
jgi:MFS family permease